MYAYSEVNNVTGSLFLKFIWIQQETNKTKNKTCLKVTVKSSNIIQFVQKFGHVISEEE